MVGNYLLHPELPQSSMLQQSPVSFEESPGLGSLESTLVHSQARPQAVSCVSQDLGAGSQETKVTLAWPGTDHRVVERKLPDGRHRRSVREVGRGGFTTSSDGTRARRPAVSGEVGRTPQRRCHVGQPMKGELGPPCLG